jgi:hypothetical protein
MRMHELVRFGLSLTLSLSFLAGCGTQQRLVYDKPGAVLPPDAQRDENECLQGAITHDASGRILTLMQIDRDAYERCMQARGYAARPAR